MKRLAAGAILILLAVGPACQSRPRLATGTWRAVLQSPGGPLPFSLVVEGRPGDYSAYALNGPEKVPFSSLQVRDDQVRLRIDGYDSEITAGMSGQGRHLVGEWRKRAAGGYSRLGFEAVHGDERRFLPVQQENAPDRAAPADDQLSQVLGDWKAVFSDEDGESPARGEFRREEGGLVGTFLTPVGDYRFLAGDYRDGLLRLSCFDGGHAFLFRARLQEDGSLQGDFWSRDSYHATWSARRLQEGESDQLPDPYQEVALNNDENRFTFSFPSLDGQIIASDDPRFQDKVVLVNVFGSWCPNCNDEAPLLAQWHERYGPQGLEVVGLAFELTGDAERDKEYVRKYARRHGIEFPLLLAGTSNKSAAGEKLSDLSAVRSYPTNIFIDRQGKVRRIHSGFAGPATGEHHRQLVRQFQELIESLLKE
ncbi:MAG TPA: TlpA disulfide reductase family protein [Acidobacteriota bacterium]|nr:TlpA disulfide reductase family protein [Acidobacteriota bacterium]